MLDIRSFKRPRHARCWVFCFIPFLRGGEGEKVQNQRSEFLAGLLTYMILRHDFLVGGCGGGRGLIGVVKLGF